MPDRPRVPQVYGAEIVDENFIPVSMNNALVRELQFPPTGGTGPTPHNTTIRFRYTFSNQIAERIDSRGVVFRYHYDAYGRMDVIQVGWYSDGTGGTFSPGYPPSMTLAYGAPADRVSRVEYEYDDANRVSWVRSKNEQEQLEGVGEPGSPGSPSPSPVSVTLASEYVWGLGDNGLDELLVKFDKLRKRWWIIQDGGGAGGDVVAIVDPGSGSTPIADVAGQWVYDAYGDVIVADHILAFPVMRIGHKGLFIDRLDVPVVESGGGESPRLVPFGHTISHNRNRLYSPQMGRFYQLDPNATAMALLEASIYHGKGVGAITLAFSMEEMYGDGMNLYEYLGSNPWNRSDPMGLSWDPFSIVDDYLAEDAGSKAAFLERIIGGAKTAAYVGSLIMSMLPFPVSAVAGEIGMAALEGHVSPELQMAAKMVGYASLGAAGVMVGKIAYTATKTAAQYIIKHGWRAAFGVALRYSPIGLAARGATWAARKISGKCGCFAAGTLVWTTAGLIPIEYVEPGDVVITLNETNGLLEFQPVTATIVTEQASLLRLSVIHESGHREVIDTTDEHPFYEESRIDGWVRADLLSPGDIVRTMGGAAIVDSLLFGNERVTVFNISVESNHTYLIGVDAVWVHNCPPFRTRSFNEAIQAALEWLYARGFSADKPRMGRFGEGKGKPVGMQSADGKMHWRLEYDERNKAHINVSGPNNANDRPPHILIETFNKADKDAVLRQLFPRDYP